MKRREPLEHRRMRNLRGFVQRLVASEQGRAPSFEPRTLGQHDQLRAGKFSAQCRQQCGITGHATDQQHPAQRMLPFLQERDHLICHAVVERVQDVRSSSLVAVELVRDVGLAVH